MTEPMKALEERAGSIDCDRGKRSPDTNRFYDVHDIETVLNCMLG